MYRLKVTSTENNSSGNGLKNRNKWIASPAPRLRVARFFYHKVDHSISCVVTNVMTVVIFLL